MLGLAQQIDRADLGIDGLVGDHQGLGRAGEEIDADAAEQLPLGLGDVGVARPHQHGDRRDARGAERHRADRLDAAQHVDLVGAGEVLGGDDRRAPAGPGRAARRWRSVRRPRPSRSRSTCGPRRAAGTCRRARSSRPSSPGCCLWPRMTPGRVSTSTSCSAARWISAKLRTCACAKRMSASACSPSSARQRSISAGLSRKSSRSQPSKRTDISRTASSPRRSMSASAASTVARTLASAAASSAAPRPRLIVIAIDRSSSEQDRRPARASSERARRPRSRPPFRPSPGARQRAKLTKRAAAAATIGARRRAAAASSSWCGSCRDVVAAWLSGA